MFKTRDNLLYYFILVFSLVKGDYRVGVGIADSTGPVAEIRLAGYAKTDQLGSGLHLRQFARAFIIDDERNTVLFVSVDANMVGYGMKKQILTKLEKLYGNTYTDQNFILSATHSHSSPGGMMMDLFFDITNFGFIEETFNAMVGGILNAIKKAHNSMQSARIYLNSGQLLNANINRSPLAYLLNPEEERLMYKYDTDKDMIQLKFRSKENDKLIGSIQWFPVHPTSMNNTNTLVSSGNVGYASILLEKHVNNRSLPGKGGFVASFASSNLGDVSPNLKGPHCLYTCKPCDEESTCDGDAKVCVGLGPGKDMFDSTKIIAERLFGKALELLKDDKAKEVKGAIKFGHQYVHMPSQVIYQALPNGTVKELKGCISAMGYSFAAGTTDGPGEFDFIQGTIKDHHLWNTMRNILAVPLPEDIICHHPKPILMMTGRMKFPYQWQPQIVSIQVAILGDVILTAVPGEFTTMAGRRLKRAVQKISAENSSGKVSTVILVGLSNIYSDYVVTPEEYQLQRYEAASTIYGPHTLPIYTELYANLTEALYKNKPFTSGPTPLDLSKKVISFTSSVIYDRPGLFHKFGDCIKQPPKTARIGDTISVSFVAGHPRNDVMHDKTFLTVDRKIGKGRWEVIATDADWETKFLWERTSTVAGTSTSTIEWTISKDVTPDEYRIRHYGHYKYILGGIFPYEGMTRSFVVV